MYQYEIKPRKLLSRIGLALFLMLLAITLVNILLETMFRIYKPEILESGWYVFLMTGALMSAIGLPIFYLVIRTVPKSGPYEINKLKVSQFLGFFIVCVAMMYLTNLLGTYINYELSSMLGKELVNPLEEVVLGSNWIIVLLYGVIIGPILEEIIFRKLLLERLRPFGDVPAILWSGLAFGLFHMNLSQFFYAGVLGFLFAYVALRTNTIRYTILLHIMINAIGLLAAPFAGNLSVMLLLGVWVIGSIIVGIIVFVKNIYRITIYSGEVLVEKKSVYIWNVGTMLYVVGCVIYMVLVLLFA